MKIILAIFLCQLCNITYASTIQSGLKVLSIKSAHLSKPIEVEIYIPNGYDEKRVTPYPLLATSAGDSRIAMLQSQIDWLSHVDFGPMPKVIMVRIPNIERSDKANYSDDELLATILHTDVYPLYPNHLKMRVSVGIKSDLGKALIASNSGSIVKINNAV
ncbi:MULTISPECIES: hypothetical protein [Pseudoalteromonas]|uniref:Uncharacterized protein n=1 Tax=Pseudoalteromonas porphyrae TaxID=187330 RepID=A0A0N0M079_9GAMM|nr:hypothetical protein [Pseudoalteromonas porphyrae]KPH63758.1 hypothetical protein ADS77_07505 [Pseudoalteromonas porphyrae]